MDTTLQNLEYIISSNCSLNNDQASVLHYLIKKIIEKEGLSEKATSIIVGIQNLLAIQGLSEDRKTSHEISSQLEEFLQTSDTIFTENSGGWKSKGMKTKAEELMRATEIYTKALAKLIDDRSDTCSQVHSPSKTVLAGMLKLRKNCLDYDGKGKSTSEIRMPPENSSAAFLNGKRSFDSVRIFRKVFDSLGNASEITISTVLYDALATILPQDMTEQSKLKTNNTKVIVNSKVLSVMVDPPLSAEQIWGDDNLLEINLELKQKNPNYKYKIFCAYYKFDAYA